MTNVKLDIVSVLPIFRTVSVPFPVTIPLQWRPWPRVRGPDLAGKPVSVSLSLELNQWNTLMPILNLTANLKYPNFPLNKFYLYRITAFIAVEIEIFLPLKLLLGYEDCLKGSLHTSLSEDFYILPHLQ